MKIKTIQRDISGVFRCVCTVVLAKMPGNLVAINMHMDGRLFTLIASLLRYVLHVRSGVPAKKILLNVA